MRKEAANKSLHIQIERRTRRTWQAQNIMPIRGKIELMKWRNSNGK